MVVVVFESAGDDVCKGSVAGALFRAANARDSLEPADKSIGILCANKRERIR